MVKICFDKQIRLYNKVPGQGSAPPTETNVTNAMCGVGTIGVKISLQAMSAGIELSKQIFMWSTEYNEQKYCQIDNIEYVVKQSIGADRAMQVKLLLARS